MSNTKVKRSAVKIIGQFVGEGIAGLLMEKGIEEAASYVPMFSQILGKDHAEVMNRLDEISKQIDDKTEELKRTVQQGFLTNPMNIINTNYDLIRNELTAIDKTTKKEKYADFASFIASVSKVTDKSKYV